MLKDFLRALRTMLLGQEFSDAVKRNSDAADGLDHAIREMLEK